MGRVIYIKWLSNSLRGRCRSKVMGVVRTKDVNEGIPSLSELKQRKYTMQAAQVLFLVVMLGVLVFCLASL